MAARKKKKKSLAVQLSGGVIPQKDGKYIPGPGEKATKLPQRQIIPETPESRLLEVPFGSYDPAIEAQLEASRRGLSDLREDTRTASHWAKKDLKTSLGDIRRSRGRRAQDLGRNFRREDQKLGFRRDDVNRDAGRNFQDFASRVADITRNTGIKAGVQQEARNAAGTLRGGTAMAAAAKRAENQTRAIAPIQQAAERTTEDLKTALGRITVSDNQLGQDVNRTEHRDVVDTRRDRVLTKRDYGRGTVERDRKLDRGIREQTAGEADLLAQKIDSARMRAPGAFSKYGKKKKRN